MLCSSRISEGLKAHPRLLVILAFIGSLASANRAFGLGGTLNSPSISVPAGRTGADWLAVLSNKKYKFVVGDFINWNTNLYYSGDTASLNSFLKDLAAVDGTVIQVAFSKESKTAASAFGGDGAPSGPCQWKIFHSGSAPEAFDVTIFLGDGKIDISQLNLPAIQNTSTKADSKSAPAAKKP